MATKLEDMKSPINPTWCPGCGNYGILGIIKQSVIELGWSLEEVVFIFGVGCSGNMADFIRGYGFHGLHGRGLAAAGGINMVNHKLHIIAIGGDGDMYGEGLNHMLAACRANYNITAIVHDNQRYSLTTGQAAPTTAQGTVTKSTPLGLIESTFNPLAVTIAADAGFVARASIVDIKQSKELLKKALMHRGFSLLDILQPCPSFNKEHTPDWYKENTKNLPDNYDPADKNKAILRALKPGLELGVFYESDRPAYTDKLPQLQKKSLVETFPAKVNLHQALASFV